MRTNLPVTNTEYELPEGISLVSRTDLNGRIVYANAAFVETSGFLEDELLGAPHKIMRHPDMPSEAFADLWATLREGLPWTGVVKNRRKDGDHYWVNANVTPVRRDGATVAYMSVRTKPPREQVVAAEALYRRFKQGEAGDLTLRHGVSAHSSRLRKLISVRSIPVNLRIMLTTGIGALLMAGAGAFGWWESRALASAAGIESWLPALIAVAGGVGAVLSILFGYFISRTILKPLDKALEVAHAIAGGDLSIRFEMSAWDETGQLMRALNQMNANMIAVVSDIGSNVYSIGAAASEIATGNANLSARTESQASSLEETASSMEQLTSTVKQNAENARQANQLVVTTADIAATGGKVVGKVVDTMASIKESSRKISDIIGVIDGIAFQTNILALNAAVEAARAGEQGRGFAVVATEVRSLAQRSASAAKEIKTLISDSVEQVDAGGQLVDETGEAMDDILTSVQLVTEIMSGIAQASQEQSAGIEQVNQAVGQMDEMTQQNATLVEEAATAAASLQDQAAKLAEAVSVFKLEGGLHNARPEPLAQGRVFTAKGTRCAPETDPPRTKQVTASARLRARRVPTPQRALKA